MARPRPALFDIVIGASPAVAAELMIGRLACRALMVGALVLDTLVVVCIWVLLATLVLGLPSAMGVVVG